MNELLAKLNTMISIAQAQGETKIIIVLIGAAIFGCVCIFILMQISRSIKELRQAAGRFAQGDLSQRVAIKGPLQIAELAEALNTMARQLEERLSTVVRQRNELGTVLTSMVEGVVAIDLDDQIISMNNAASTMLEVDPTHAIGRSIQEVIRNTALQTFVKQTHRQDAPISTEITLRMPDNPEGDRQLQAQSAILRDAAGIHIGVVLVLHDVTRLRRLESVRQDFVANVSHEVKTPVSAIKASVETILDDSELVSEQGKPFLNIILRQADRLAAIVEDLLSIARIEQDGQDMRAELMSTHLIGVLRAVNETCSAIADKKNTEVQIICSDVLTCQTNPPLLEQAIVNLLTNAIKYSPENTLVQVISELHDNEVIISVTDQGRGIEPEHLPRIFERFYRTDKARSRELGGTGLGLSIVKHVAEAHGGRVSVDSVLGSGSTFRIHLPAKIEVNDIATTF
ncbi:Alkaline phosphatase synthesis sensor protein PhoR [Poriferisphaera corsica]|uniref:histidine kinase n=1 Tax=Poriferisphaera corsica TaxID=2528020 RepID=A0A517YQG5_9BACT|nr:HAMP domain-containing sensor histidine kinase [Poriferisphaera corsica]QDU32450.1 Alkaline phosphatase synthesis sensor protein PhoR [Poriferisphaera corsica]